MRLLTCTVAHFRGFDHIEVVPRGHVLLVGEPRSGRSDLLAALGKVLEPDIGHVDELDFHTGDTAYDVSIEITLGDLDHELRQRFLDQLEFWDPDAGSLLVGVDDPAALGAHAVPVVRLGERAPGAPVLGRGRGSVIRLTRPLPITVKRRRSAGLRSSDGFAGAGGFPARTTHPRLRRTPPDPHTYDRRATAFAPTVARRCTPWTCQ